MLPLYAPRVHGAVAGELATARGHAAPPQPPRPEASAQAQAPFVLAAAGTALSAAQAAGSRRTRRRHGARATRGHTAVAASGPKKHEVSWIGGLSEISDQYDAFFVDLWGVVHNGAVAFPWAVKALEELKAKGKPVVFLSNSSRLTSTNFKTMEKLGISRDLYVDMITSGQETFKLLNAGADADALPSDVREAKKLLTFGNNSDDGLYLEGLEGRAGASPEEAELVLARGCASICTSGCDAKKATWEDIEAALEVLAKRKVPMVVSNPDSVRPDGDDSPMPGRIAARYIELGGPVPYFIGKPYPDVFEAAFDSLSTVGLPKSARVCMIGDSAWHDVRGARRFGLDAVLLASGVHASALGIQQAPAPPSRPSAERTEAFLGALQHDEAPTYMTSAMAWEGAAAAPAASAGKSPKVITCGLACVDILLSISNFPEPDDKTRTEDSAWLGGGNAANTACALARLGTPTAILSMVGEDAMGKGIIDDLKVDGVITDSVVLASDSPTSFTSVLVDVSTVTRTCLNTPMSRDLTTEEALARVDGLFGDASSEETKLLHLDCRHPTAAVALAEAVRSRPNVLITMDAERPRPGLEELLQLSDVIFCNSRFPELWTGESGVPKALKTILDRCPRARFVVVTRGEKGSMLMARASEADKLVPEAVKGQPLTCCQGSYDEYLTLTCDVWPLPGEILDSTGAGDVFIAGFLHAFVAGKPYSAAMATGAYTATQKLGRLGARLGPAFDAAKVPL